MTLISPGEAETKLAHGKRMKTARAAAPIAAINTRDMIGAFFRGCGALEDGVAQQVRIAVYVELLKKRQWCAR